MALRIKSGNTTDPAAPKKLLKQTKQSASLYNEDEDIKSLQPEAVRANKDVQWTNAAMPLATDSRSDELKGRIEDSDPSNRSLQERIMDIGKPDAWRTMTGPQESSFSDPISNEEAADLEGLLISMLRYNPRERMMLDQISTHRLVSRKYPSDGEGDWLQRCSPDLGEAPTFVWRDGTAFRIS